MYQRIIVPIDGSDTSTQALASAIGLAKESGGRVRLVHVVEELAYLTGYDQFGGYAGDLLKIMRETGAKILDNGLATAAAAGVAADQVLYDNLGERLPEVVAEEARRWNADLIVVGTHGRRGVGRMLLGSGAEQIVRTAPVPVLVIRSAAAAQPASGKPP
ncbi:universal stress protein [Ramlibacter sp.]|uniref:universal stress protein n=1 Tax=Ramlibacter sp. TaxID=1917967 RepID=UPI002C7E67A0|nr:universal stress protein [Ramlibacter sp.]HWI81187.1 universal stress protein [Ramlibacter sp.]